MTSDCRCGCIQMDICTLLLKNHITFKYVIYLCYIEIQYYYMDKGPLPQKIWVFSITRVPPYCSYLKQTSTIDAKQTRLIWPTAESCIGIDNNAGLPKTLFTFRLARMQLNSDR